MLYLVIAARWFISRRPHGEGAGFDAAEEDLGCLPGGCGVVEVGGNGVQVGDGVLGGARALGDVDGHVVAGGDVEDVESVGGRVCGCGSGVENGVGGVGEGDLDGLDHLGNTVVRDGDRDGLAHFARGEGEGAGSRGVIGTGRSRAVGCGVVDGDGLRGYLGQ